MQFENETYVINDGVLYEGVLRDIKRSRLSLQPVYEAFTNALEAIKLRQSKKEDFQPEITITIRSRQTTDGNYEFEKLEIEDNGVGFNDKEFERFNRYKDFTKGFKNLGSGRIQYAHYFDRTNFVSNYKTDTETRQRKFLVSKHKDFIKHNAITYHKSDLTCEECESGTRVTFNGLLDNTRRIYHELTDSEIKTGLLERYLQYFCFNKSDLPTITIKHYVFEELKGESSIEASDIPDIDKTDTVTLNFCKISRDGKSIEYTDKTADFNINSFRIKGGSLGANKINLTSKNEIVENVELELELLSKKDMIDGDHFLFLISSDYIDERDSNERGQLSIPTLESFRNNDLFSEEEILLDDIQSAVNDSLVKLYPEIGEIKAEHESNIEKLKEMFLLDDEDINFKISVNDTENKILEKIYSNEAKKAAEIDANIKDRFDYLNQLDTRATDYLERLQEEVEKLVKIIPIQNKTALTHYVARRKLVLELFDKILARQLQAQSSGERNEDEKLLHNLIFQQSNASPETSDLWLINEDFVFFNGTSETKIDDLEINGTKIIRETLTEEEEEFRVTLGENRFAKRPDILLFPEESKCIIIELKNPDKSVSDHLNQISNYATLLRNYTNPEFKFTTFYGYLIGEKVDARDVIAHDSDFVQAYHYDFLYRNHKTVAAFFVPETGSLYMEVIKYSSLLERAKKRNEKFIEKLTRKLNVTSAIAIEPAIEE